MSAAHVRDAWSFRRWAAFGSIVWIVAAYGFWLRYVVPDPDLALANAQSQCEIARAYDTFVRAECLHNAVDAYHVQHVEVASKATFIAIVPVIAFWTALVGILFWRCPETNARTPSAGRISDSEWRRRIEAKRSDRQFQSSRDKHPAL